MNIGAYKVRDIERCGHKDTHSCRTLTIPCSPPVTVNSDESPLLWGPAALHGCLCDGLRWVL